MSLQSLIVDTDMAIDDWIALLYLLRSPRVDLRAITIAGTGEAHGYFGRRKALRLLALSQARPCAVASGRAKPLRGRNAFPFLVRLAMDFHLGLPLPVSRHLPASGGAAALLTHQLRHAQTPVTILALGPLTNLAEILTTEPQLTQQIAMIYIMGGALDVAGNLGELMWCPSNPYAEWNFYVDPYAVEIVLHSGVPLTLIPLDVTNQHPLTTAFYKRLTTAATNDAGTFLVGLLGRVRWLLGQQRTFYFWDPLAAVVAIHPEIATFQTRKISIIAEENPECGRLIDNVDGNWVRVCTAVDRCLFEEILLQSFCQCH